VSIPVLNGKRLGRKAYDRTRPNVKIRRLRSATLTPPAQSDWWTDAMATMGLNDQIGCCTMADQSHSTTQLQWFGQNRTLVVPDQEILKGYSAVSGYDPKTGRNDNGATLQDAFDYMRKTGFTVAGTSYKVEAFAELDAIDSRGNVDWDLIKTCMDAFGGASIGMVFPDYAMDDFDAGREWDYTPRKRYREAGGHDVRLVGFGGTGAGAYVDCATWGQKHRMTIPFAEKFIEEYWCHGERDWQRPDGTVPNGIDADSAKAQFIELTGETGDPGWDSPDVVVPPVDPPVDPPVTEDADAQLADAYDKLPIEQFREAITIWRATKGL
jgi:hypothetical protein